MPSHTCKDPRRSDGATLGVEFEIDSWGTSPSTCGLPEDSDPGEAPEISLLTAVDITGANVLDLLSDEQHEVLADQVLSEFDFDYGSDFDDSDLYIL